MTSSQKNEFNHFLFETQQKINLTIGFRFRHRVVACKQVRVSGVRSLCEVWMLGRFGPVGPDFRLPTPSPISPPWLITRDCEQLARF